ncbi:hypothetical protein HDU76_002698 [Blyttiomyces sp. JEL0837]|nr:hypothetical protein HDU76_002698 [Blyttiomyces sp. JEL0837]
MLADDVDDVQGGDRLPVELALAESGPSSSSSSSSSTLIDSPSAPSTINSSSSTTPIKYTPPPASPVFVKKVLPQEFAQTTKTSLKNKKRNEKRRQNKKQQTMNMMAEYTKLLQEENEKEAVESTVVVSTTTVTHHSTENNTPKMAAGSFSLLPYELVLKILTLLPASSIVTMSTACKFLHLAAEDGYLWKMVFSSLYPTSALKGKTTGDWKHVFQVETSGIVQDLRCFHNKTTYKDDIIGIPLEFTINPVKEVIDYMDSTFDLLSHHAFKVEGVRRTVWSEEFSEWIPLYLTEEHFERALPQLKLSLRRLCPHIISSGFHPKMVIEVLPRLMKTQMVLLCDKGIHNSDAFLTNLFQIHRVFAALVSEFPELQTVITNMLKQFRSSESARHKDVVPNLGDFVPVMSVVNDPRKAWREFGPAFVKEIMDRGVLWICRLQPELAKLKPIPKENKGIETDRIAKSYPGVEVALKQLAIFACLFRYIGSGRDTDTNAASSSPLINTIRSHDLFYGRPPTRVLDTLRSRIAVILAADSFEKLLPLLDLPFPFITPFRPDMWTRLLREGVSNSLKKKYHTKNTDFRRIHRSGVSKILRKGQSYKCPPGIKKVVMEESWRIGGGGSTYLDASALMFDYDGAYICVSDYAHRIPPEMNGAVTHSGDVMDYEHSLGSHQIQISLASLPPKVKTIVFTMTAWTGDIYSIIDPSVRLFDSESKSELCKYDFQAGTASLGKTLVVMCTLARDRSDAQGLWQVKAMGELGMGTARDYTPIIQCIKDKKML